MLAYLEKDLYIDFMMSLSKSKDWINNNYNEILDIVY